MKTWNRSMCVLLTLVIVILLGFSPAGGIRSSAAEMTVITLTIGDPSITVNGTPHPIDASGTTPAIVAGRTLLPIRAVVEAIGGTIEWDAATRTVTITSGTATMTLVIGSRMATVNGTRLPIDPQNATVVPLIVSGRTMLPVRFVGEQLGGTVAWDQATRTATLTFVAPSPLTAPALLEPADGALFTSTTVAFRWTPVDGATSYDLSVSKAGSEVYRGTSTTTSLVASGTALSGGQYSWTISAVRGSTVGPVSLPSRFAVRLVLSPAEVVKRATPAVAEVVVDYADGRRGVAGAFAIDATGIFVTTYETIKGGIKAVVVLSDGSQHADVRVLGYDPSSNIAILRAAGSAPVQALALVSGQSAQLNQEVVMVGPVVAGVPQPTVSGVVNVVGTGTFSVRGNAENAVEGAPILDAFAEVLGMVSTDIEPASGTFPAMFASSIRAVPQTVSLTVDEVTEREGTGLQALDRPVLAGPAGEAVIGSLTPSFRWNTVTGATKYQFWVGEGRNASGTGITSQVITYVNPVIRPGVLKPGTTYTWAVRAGNERGWGPWSPDRMFTTSGSIVQPSSPTILEPLDRAIIKSAEPVLFWTALPGSNRYYVWIGLSDEDTVFETSTTNTSVTIPAGTLTSGETYLWTVRVESSSGVSSLWVAPHPSFTVSVPSGTGVPALLGPAPKAVLPFLNPTLTWQAVPGATRYDVFIDKGTSESAVFEKVVAETSLAVPAGVLTPGVEYRWSVIAGTSDGWSKTGDAWNWSLARLLTISPTAVIDVLPPHLLSPADGAVLATLSPTLQWNSVQGATWYRVYVGKGAKETELEQVLSVIVAPKGGDTQQYAVSSGILESGTTYFWRILAGAGEDIESPAFNRFKTAP